MTRFKTLAATALLSLAATLGTAQAQTFPDKPISPSPSSCLTPLAA